MTRAHEARCRTLSRGSSAIAFAVAAVCSASAFAQGASNQAADPDAIAEVIVTGSRIRTAGFDAPTPTTVLGEAELQQAGRTDIAASLADMPQFRATQTATSTNTVTASGVTPADLRGLGSARTLVLINNRRYVSSFDLQTVPYSLVKRIDVVTGGASAAYGSGAVAGVVNILLDEEMQGVEVGVQSGTSSRTDAEKYLVEAAFGTKFLDDRGHFMIGADYLEDKGIIPAMERPLIGGAGFFPGADGRLYPTADLQDSDRSEGGLINTGVLAGQTFNPDGSLRPFQYGVRHPGAATTMVGGEGFNLDHRRSLSAPIERTNVFARASYEVSDSLRAWVEGAYNEVADKRVYFPDLVPRQVTLSRDNPFLNASARAALVAAGETTFRMGRVLSDVALVDFDYARETQQASIGLDGTFGESWRYDVYYSHGKQTQDQNLIDLTLRTPLNNALDAVVGPNGTPVCRVALTDPNTACRPLNLFGSGRADPAAVDYVTDDWRAFLTQWLDSAGASISGEPFQLWNQPVSVAAGVEYRKEAFSLSYDANSLAGNFNTINGANISKVDNNVKEAFAEVAIPLLADLPFVQKLNFNGAVRVSDYSTGDDPIWSWKLGGTWQIVDDLKLRATRSRDIRAAALTELFAARTTFFTNVLDVGQTPPITSQVILYTGGNPELEPEIADTLTVGAVLSPSFLPGFELSVDYYDIAIEDVISTLSAQQIVNSCYQQGNQDACAQIVRNPAGLISEINASLINIAEFNTKGFDVEASYRTGLDGIGMPGQLSVRALANYVDTLVSDNGIIAIDGAGFLGAQAPFLAPKWRGSLTFAYEGDWLGADIRTRYVDSGGFAPPQVLANIGNNHIASRTYVDLGLRAHIPIGEENRLTVYGSVQNVFDRDPALAAVSSPYLDLIGRYFTLGVRANF